MENFSQAGIVNDVTCPFCGLLCDDLTVERSADGNLKIKDKGCAKSMTFFERPVITPPARVGGKPVELAEAVATAARILKQSNLPLIAGLGTDVYGMRSVMSLADKTGAVLDHMNSNGFMRNIQVVQNSGWMITTLTEVRNRVDLLVVIGTDIVSVFPRFFEREVWNKETLFGHDTSKRQVVYLGGRNIDTSAGIAPDGRKPDVLPCDLKHLQDVTAALRAIVSGKKLHNNEVAGIAVADLGKLAQRLRNAKYSVVVWAAAALNYPHAELTVQNITETVKILNKTTRSSGLPLGGIEGDMNANQVCTWISGYPMRTSFARSYPEHDIYQYSTDHLLASGEADALLWVSSFNPDRTPPDADLPTIVLGHPSMKLKHTPDVFIPVGLPGADHKGIMFRTDNVVSLPLSKLRACQLPSVAEVITAIELAHAPMDFEKC
jgi:formylmethanofuran dehydrogenase subunit B